MRPLFFVLWVLLLSQAGAQVPVRTDVMEQAMEGASSAMADREEDDHGRAMEADGILKARFAINQVDPDELAHWVGLTPLQARQFALYRERFGPFIDLMELQAVPGWDLETVRRAIPWLRIAADPRLLPLLRERWEKGTHRLLWRMSQRFESASSAAPGSTPEKGYAGGNTAMLFRYRFAFRNLLQIGFALEKDAGEPLLTRSRGGPFDFQSFHFALREVGRWQSLVVGDFLVNFGQGLVHWQGLSFRKTADAGLVLRQGQGIRPYQGNDENRFHRGVAAGIGLGLLQLSVFLAMDRLDGNLVRDSTATWPVHVTSLQTSGLHRTAAEIHDKDAFPQKSVGGSLTFRKEVFRASLNGVVYSFKWPLVAGDRPADRGDINGRGWHNLSADYGWTLRNMHLFGEAALDRRGGRAFLQGVIMSLHSRLDLSMVFRDIGPFYRALQAQAFTEQSAPMNERGLYTGIVLRPHPAWRVDAYADIFSFPTLTHSVDRPSNGSGSMVHVLWKPRKHVEATLRWQSETKETQSACEGCNMREIVAYRRSGVRWQLAVDRPFGISFRSRIEISRHSEGSVAEDGFVAFADIRYKPMESPFSFSGRVCLFDTEGYGPRIYAYENDVPFSHSMSPLYGRGLRLFVVAGCRLGQGGHLAFRVSGTGKRGAAGSAESERGGGRLDLKMQLTWEL